MDTQTIALIGINRGAIRVVLSEHKWTRGSGMQWNDNQALWLDVPSAYKCEFEILAKAYGMPVRAMHTGTLVYRNCGKVA